MKNFFKRISFIFRYRIMLICAAFCVLFALVIIHLFRLQIIKGAEYSEGLKISIEKNMTTPASRGRIYDRNGELLAYDDLAYAVNISDNGSYSSIKEKNKTINETIRKTLEIIRTNGDAYSNDFGIALNENNEYYYTVSDRSLLGFLRDCYGVPSIEDLTDEQKKSSPQELIAHMIETYQVDTEGIDATDLLELLYLRMNMTANSYTRYMTFTIASDISEKTMSAILESQNNLTGITVDEKYVRRYNDPKYYSAIIGYTGVISREQLSEYQNIYPEKNYEKNDNVGKNGIEEKLEHELTGQKGERHVYLDTVGRITEEIDGAKSVSGHDVYLTIDSALQKRLYDILEDKLTDIIIEHLRDRGAKYSTTSDGSVSDIYIRMSEVYFALIKNNLVSIDSLKTPKTELEKEIYKKFKTKSDETIAWIEQECRGSGTKYKELNEKQQAYVSDTLDALRENNIINTDLISSEDNIYTEWKESGETSLRRVLEYAIDKGHVDTSVFLNDEYSDTKTIYKELISYICKNLDSYRYFALDLYEELIEDEEITGIQLCQLLYDQGYLKEDDLFQSLKDGDMSGRGFITRALKSKTLTPGDLGLQPSSGGAVVTDPSNGQLLAVVSYPGYDNNRISGDMDKQYYSRLQFNSSKPMYNWATQAKCAPGSIFKLCTAITALDMGVASAGTGVTCTGLYTDITPHPKCWVYPSSHGYEDMPEAIKDSCNVYFYTMGSRIASNRGGVYDSEYGTDMLRNYAEELGLATKSGIEIEESEPQPSDTSAIASAIGQGTAAYSCINISRYVSTIVSEGTCYNSNLVLKITDHDGNVIRESTPVIAGTMDDVSDSTWNTVKHGMRLATATYPALNSIKDYGIACKTGTSQPSVYEPDNATYVSYAPYNDPEITLSIEVPFGYTSLYNTEMAAQFYSYYFDEYSKASKQE